MERIDKTFLEVLLEELPKRGGWPKGAAYARQDLDCEVCFMGCGIDHDFFIDGLAKDAIGTELTDLVTVTFEQYCFSSPQPYRSLLLNGRFGKC